MKVRYVKRYIANYSDYIEFFSQFYRLEYLLDDDNDLEIVKAIDSDCMTIVTDTTYLVNKSLELVSFNPYTLKYEQSSYIDYVAYPKA